MSASVAQIVTQSLCHLPGWQAVRKLGQKLAFLAEHKQAGCMVHRIALRIPALCLNAFVTDAKKFCDSLGCRLAAGDPGRIGSLTCGYAG